jgi:hypothetical protein
MGISSPRNIIIEVTQPYLNCKWSTSPATSVSEASELDEFGLVKEAKLSADLNKLVGTFLVAAGLKTWEYWSITKSCCLTTASVSCKSKEDLFQGVSNTVNNIVTLSRSAMLFKSLEVRIAHAHYAGGLFNPKTNSKASKTQTLDTILGICYVFPVIHIIPLFYSQTISLLIMKLFGCRIVE